MISLFKQKKQKLLDYVSILDLEKKEVGVGAHPAPGFCGNSGSGVVITCR